MSDTKEKGRTKGGDGTQAGEVVVRSAVPIFRIFDVAKAHEFYVDYLGCTLDWEHRFAPGMPLYTQVSRSGLVLHLSEHHGDATPGSTVYVELTGVRALHAELTAKDYPYLRPGLEEDEFGTCLTLTDPFGNRLRFNEPPPEGRQG
ncbi:glyoxalase superfamily protein [Streptomyces sp. 769]|uniref:glyoxalase superfamily protein n=1 Tax=Streptomyces sp. 769 TaxID=1262452 RepID=UPI00058229FA|nr:glyoxalase superfamily protein [Streptomyces sp. 769]AJC54892.1 bleomycin resistance protein/dioxygenase [Streptomyces sp. 769]